MKVRPAALKNEEAQEARKQHADNGAGEALSRYGVTVLHATTTTTSRRPCQLRGSWFHETRGGAHGPQTLIVSLRSTPNGPGSLRPHTLVDPGSTKHAAEPTGVVPGRSPPPSGGYVTGFGQRMRDTDVG